MGEIQSANCGGFNSLYLAFLLSILYQKKEIYQRCDIVASSSPDGSQRVG